MSRFPLITARKVAKHSAKPSSFERKQPLEDKLQDNKRFFGKKSIGNEREPSKKIRLVKVLPGKHGDPLRCRLRAHKLKKLPPYFALSYSWGPLEHRYETVIGINGRLGFWVSKHLESALLSIRKLKEPTYCWVDIICINQAHTPERNGQLALMGDIYARAKVVYAYLGEEWAGPWHERENRSMFTRDRPELTKTHEWILDSTQTGEHAWWVRVWVVQEYVRAEHLHFVFGKHTMPWQKFLEGARLPPAGRMEPNDFKILKEARDSLEAMAAIKDIYSGYGPEGKATNLHQLLRRTAGHRATDGHDKVYALLGLVRTTDEDTDLASLAPDYNEKYWWTYAETAVFIMQSDKSLDLLTDVWRPWRGTSWVPDFSDTSLTRDPVVTRNKDYLALSAFAFLCQVPVWPQPPFTSLEGLQLQIRGFEIDTVAQTISGACLTKERFSQGSDDSDPRRVVFIRQIDEMAIAATSTTRPKWSTSDPRSGIALKKSFYRELIMQSQGDLDNDMVATPPTLGFLESVKKRFSTGRKVEPSFEDLDLQRIDSSSEPLLSELVGNLTQRTFFTTEHGLICIGSQNVKKGDVIVAACGASVPFVLRKNEPNDSYSLQGDTYVYGIMHGELERLVRSRKYRHATNPELYLRDFTLQ